MPRSRPPPPEGAPAVSIRSPRCGLGAGYVDHPGEAGGRARSSGALEVRGPPTLRASRSSPSVGHMTSRTDSDFKLERRPPSANRRSLSGSRRTARSLAGTDGARRFAIGQRSELKRRRARELPNSNPEADRQRSALCRIEDVLDPMMMTDLISPPRPAAVRTSQRRARSVPRRLFALINALLDARAFLPRRVTDPARSGASPASCRSRKERHAVIIPSSTPHRRSPA